MADEFTIEIQGVDELEAQMEKLLKSVSPSKAEPVLMDAARSLRDEIKARAPKGPTGNLRRAVVAKQAKSRSGGGEAVLGISEGNVRPAFVAMDYKIAPHYGLVEFGHAGPHPAPPHPFFRPTWDSKRGEIERQIVTDIEHLIDEGLA